MHGSAIENNAQGFIFLGTSGSGKSFFSSSLLGDSKLITEDICRIRIIEGMPYIYKSHPLMKIDNNINLDQKLYDHKSRLNLDARNRSSIVINEKFMSQELVPIKSCFCLKFGNKFNFKKLNSRQSFAMLLLSSFNSNPYPSCTNDALIHEKIGLFLKYIKIFEITRPTDFKDFELINDIISTHSKDAF